MWLTVVRVGIVMDKGRQKGGYRRENNIGFISKH
jgi:hypothetical protein